MSDTSSRSSILEAIRRSLGESPGHDNKRRAAVEQRLGAHAKGPIPKRASGPAAVMKSTFIQQAVAARAAVEELESWQALPQAVAAALRAYNLAGDLRLARDENLLQLDWVGKTPTLTIKEGAANKEDSASLANAFAGVAETGTLVFCSGPAHPPGLLFLPPVSFVAIHENNLVGAMEDVWSKLPTGKSDARRLPRSINMVTGPSRTGDIEQIIQLGAHGPSRLHIFLIQGD